MKKILTAFVAIFIGCLFAQSAVPPQYEETIIKTKANLSRIFDISFGYPYQSKIELRDNGITDMGWNPDDSFTTRCRLKPKNPWTFTKNGKTERACEKYTIYLTNKTKYACRIEIERFHPEAIDGIFGLVRQTYGDFPVPPKTNHDHRVVFVCERTPKRTITLYFRYGNFYKISFYCADIDERDRDTAKFSGKL